MNNHPCTTPRGPSYLRSPRSRTRVVIHRLQKVPNIWRNLLHIPAIYHDFIG